MLRFFYNIFLIILYVPYSAAIFLRIFFKKEHGLKFREKLFFKKIRRPDGFVFWFHVASLGEFNSIIPLIDYYLSQNKKYNFLITTLTLSSYNEFKKKYGDNNRVFHQFLPYDSNFLISNFLRSWKPNIVSFVDSEVWPNFIFEIRNKNIPLVFLNARITQKTFNRWMNFEKFASVLFGNFSICIASSKETQENLKALKAKNIKYFGNIKFCSNTKKEEWVNDLQFQNIKDKKTWCAVSTHDNEEIFCSKVHKIIKENLKNSLCIIIPRHVNRTKEIYSKLEAQGFKIQIKNEGDLIDGSVDIVLINYYGAVNIFLSKIKNVFIGKSLIKRLIKVGGQNPIDAAKMGCYIFHGPYVSNFREIYQDLKNKKFSEEINYPEELAKKLIKNLNNTEKVVDKVKLEELEIYSKSIFKKVINEYNVLVNENFKT